MIPQDRLAGVVAAVGGATLVGLATATPAADPRTVKVTISDKGCPPPSSPPRPGPRRSS